MVRAPTFDLLKEKIKSFLRIRSERYIFYGKDHILLFDDNGKMEIKEEDAIKIINSSDNINVICSTDSHLRKEISHMADVKKIPLINNQYIWEFIVK